MSDGRTDEAIIAALMRKLPQYGWCRATFGARATASSSPHLGAIKRECLMVSRRVARPGDVDRMWEIFTAPGIPPFPTHGPGGPDVVLKIEEHYAQVRPGIPEGPRKLLRQYLDEGRVGVKSGRGFYEYPK